jgi:imidazolonepropionase-like amidohydrolase
MRDRFRAIGVVGLLLGLLSHASPAVAAAEPGPAPTLALVGGQVVDGYGGPPIRDGVVLIAGERIVAVGPQSAVAVPAGTPILSTEGMTVLPGLMDMHVHLMILGHASYRHWDTTYMPRFRDEIMPVAAKQLLLSGVTTVRDLGARLEDILPVRERIARGEILGPRLFVSGPFLQRAPYEEYEKEFRWGIAGAADARAKTQRLVDAGVDFIKLIDQDQLTDAEVAAIVETAHRSGRKVIAHGHREDEIRMGLQHGVDGFEHTGLATAPRYPEDILAGLRKRNNTLYWCPTIEGLFLAEYTARAFPERLDDPEWQRDVPAEIARDIRDSFGSITSLDYFALTFRRLPTLANKFRELRETGVTLLVGTDSGIPGNFHTDSTWRELVKFVEFGMTPLEAIAAATRWPARFLGKEHELGTLEAGALADVIAVRGDVLQEIGLLKEVDVVVQGGQRKK